MKELPDDLAALPVRELTAQRVVLDAEIAPLFRRWPALNRLELNQLRRLYAERLRIAKYWESAKGVGLPEGEHSNEVGQSDGEGPIRVSRRLGPFLFGRLPRPVGEYV